MHVKLNMLNRPRIYQLVWVECVIATVWMVACNSPDPHKASNRQFRDPNRIATDLFEGRYTFPYVASVEKRRRILNALEKLKSGCRTDQVVELAGPPDYCQTWGPKVYPAKGLELTYYLYKEREPRLKEGVDVVVYLKFDLDGQLVKMPAVKSGYLEQMVNKCTKNPAPQSR